MKTLLLSLVLMVVAQAPSAHAQYSYEFEIPGFKAQFDRGERSCFDEIERRVGRIIFGNPSNDGKSDYPTEFVYTGSGRGGYTCTCHFAVGHYVKPNIRCGF